MSWAELRRAEDELGRAEKGCEEPRWAEKS